jgi:NitT/TauT family transport system ATP-binding protein
MNLIQPHNASHLTTDDQPAIAISGLGRSFPVRHGSFTALQDIDLDVAAGEFVCIVGPSGCGKSTLLRILARLDTPTAGTIRIVDRTKENPLTCTVFQQESVFPWLTVEQNAAYGLKVTGRWRKAEHGERVAYFLDRTGLTKFRSYYPHQLSGGMKQRLAVARAFISNPQILLMDEPFAALDEQNKRLLQEELGLLWEESRNTVVFITHSIDEAVLLGDRVVVMSAAPGRIVADIKVPFPRPRDLSELRNRVEFGKLTSEVWDLLRDEVLKARAQLEAVEPARMPRRIET